MSLETYLKRTVKSNDLPYVKQAIKEWLIQKRQENREMINEFQKPCIAKYNLLSIESFIDELLEELQK